MRHLVWATGLWVGCAAGTPGDTDTDGDDEVVQFDLSDGTRVVVEPNGETVLEVEGRPTLRLTEHGPVARTFDERVEGVSGIMRFPRSNEVLAPLSTFVGAEQVDDSVVLQWRGDEHAATLRVFPSTTPARARRPSSSR
jgi:hypothetical protein